MGLWVIGLSFSTWVLCLFAGDMDAGWDMESWFQWSSLN